MTLPLTNIAMLQFSTENVINSYSHTGGKMNSPRAAWHSATRRSRLTLVLIVSAIGLAISAAAPPAASAVLRPSVSRHTISKNAVPCSFTGWSAQSPGKCGSSAAVRRAVRRAVRPAVRGNGAGCSGWFESADNVMNCENTSITRNGYRVGIRQGYYNPEANPEGFGWTKALQKHNLWIQPTIDAIAGAFPQGSDTNRNYEIYHYTNGVFDQAVLVVADIADTEFDGISTHDGHPVGVITGYCLNDVLAAEQDCPDWVDTTL